MGDALGCQVRTARPPEPGERPATQPACPAPPPASPHSFPRSGREGSARRDRRGGRRGPQMPGLLPGSLLLPHSEPKPCSFVDLIHAHETSSGFREAQGFSAGPLLVATLSSLGNWSRGREGPWHSGGLLSPCPGVPPVTSLHFPGSFLHFAGRGSLQLPKDADLTSSTPPLPLPAPTVPGPVPVLYVNSSSQSP